MNTLTDDLEMLIEDEQDHNDGLFHGVHVSCQLDRDYPTASCGRVMKWRNINVQGSRTLCQKCYRPGVRCPICGVVLSTDVTA